MLINSRNINERAKLGIVSESLIDFGFSTFSSTNECNSWCHMSSRVVWFSRFFIFPCSVQSLHLAWISALNSKSIVNRHRFHSSIERDLTQLSSNKQNLHETSFFFSPFFPTAKLENVKNMKLVYDRAWRVQDMKFFFRLVLHNWVTRDISWKNSKIYSKSSN